MKEEPLSKWGWVGRSVHLQEGWGTDDVILWTGGMLSKTLLCYPCVSLFLWLWRPPPVWWEGFPCFGNHWLQELGNSVISNTATLRGPVSNASHRFFNQSISMYVLIAYYVQGRFTRRSRCEGWSTLQEAFVRLLHDRRGFPNGSRSSVWKLWYNADSCSGLQWCLRVWAGARATLSVVRWKTSDWPEWVAMKHGLATKLWH